MAATLKAESLCRGALDEDLHVVFQAPDAWSHSELTKTAQLWELNENQLAKVKQLGERLSDIHHFKNCPDQAVRFLITHRYNIDSAERMFRKMMVWRQQHNVDAIPKPHPNLIGYFPGAIMKGRDKEGDPIFLNRNGPIQATRLFEQYGKEGFLHYVIWIREHVSRGAWRTEFDKTKPSKPSKMITIVDDLEGLKLWSIISHPTILRAFAEGMRIDQDYYPESAKRIIVIRCPAMFETIWRIVRNCFDPHIRDKMVFCSKNTYESVLAEYMDLKVLPREVTPHGVGVVDIDMPSNFTGIPPDQLDEDDSKGTSTGKVKTEAFSQKQQTGSSSGDEDGDEYGETLC